MLTVRVPPRPARADPPAEAPPSARGGGVPLRCALQTFWRFLWQPCLPACIVLMPALPACFRCLVPACCLALPCLAACLPALHTVNIQYAHCLPAFRVFKDTTNSLKPLLHKGKPCLAHAPQKNIITFFGEAEQAQTCYRQGKADAVSTALNKKTEKFLLDVL